MHLFTYDPCICIVQIKKLEQQRHDQIIAFIIIFKELFVFNLQCVLSQAIKIYWSCWATDFSAPANVPSLHFVLT